MTKLLAFIVRPAFYVPLAILVCLLSGCGSSTSTPTASPPPSPAASPSSGGVTAQQTEEFYSLMAQSGFPNAGPEYLSVGLAVCEDWRRGFSLNDEIVSLVAEGFQGHAAREAGAALAVGTYVFCPEYRDKLNEAAQGSRA